MFPTTVVNLPSLLLLLGSLAIFRRAPGQQDASEHCPPRVGTGDGGSLAPSRFVLPKAAEMHAMLRGGDASAMPRHTSLVMLFTPP